MNDGKSVIVHYTAPSFAGGVEIVILDALRLCSKQAFPTHLLYGCGSVPLLPFTNSTRLPLLDAKHPEIQRANHQVLELGVATDALELSRRIESDLGALLSPDDTLHVHNVVMNTFNLPLLLALHGLLMNRRFMRLIAWSWDPYWMSPEAASLDFSGPVLRLLKTPWQYTEYFVAAPSRLRSLLDAGFPSSTVRLVSPYIDLARVYGITGIAQQIVDDTNLLSADVVLIYPCRASRRKNLEYALHIVHCLKNRGWNPRLLISAFISPHQPAKSQTYLAEVRLLARQLDIEPELVFLSDWCSSHSTNTGVANPDVMSLLRLSDVLLSTSHDEGFGLAMLEALLSGVPIVASRQTIDGLMPVAGAVAIELTSAPMEVAEIIIEQMDHGFRRRELMRKFGNGKLWNGLYPL